MRGKKELNFFGTKWTRKAKGTCVSPREKKEGTQGMERRKRKEGNFGADNPFPFETFTDLKKENEKLPTCQSTACNRKTPNSIRGGVRDNSKLGRIE